MDANGDKSPFGVWWYTDGSGIIPRPDDDMESHAHRVSQIAWSNGAYKAREAILSLRTEVNCRIEHGAESGGHLEYVQARLDEILNQSDVKSENQGEMNEADA